jgi:hypothetical protein
MKKVRVIFAVCLLLAALPAAAVSSGQSPEERLFEEGQKAYSASDYATALAKFQRALGLAKDSGNRPWEICKPRARSLNSQTGFPH